MNENRYMKVQALFRVQDTLMTISNSLHSDIFSTMYKFHEAIDGLKPPLHFEKLQIAKTCLDELKELYRTEIEEEASTEYNFDVSMLKQIRCLSEQVRKFECIVGDDLVRYSGIQRWRLEFDVDVIDPENMKIPVALDIQLNFDGNLPPRTLRIPSLVIHYRNHRINTHDPLRFSNWSKSVPLRHIEDISFQQFDLSETLKACYEQVLINLDEMLHIESICFNSKVFKAPYLFVINKLGDDR